jgi:hypothetical protein
VPPSSRSARMGLSGGAAPRRPVDRLASVATAAEYWPLETFGPAGIAGSRSAGPAGAAGSRRAGAGCASLFGATSAAGPDTVSRTACSTCPNASPAGAANGAVGSLSAIASSNGAIVAAAGTGILLQRGFPARRYIAMSNARSGPSGKPRQTAMFGRHPAKIAGPIRSDCRFCRSGSNRNASEIRHFVVGMVPADHPPPTIPGAFGPCPCSVRSIPRSAALRPSPPRSAISVRTSRTVRRSASSASTPSQPARSTA